MSCDDWRNSLKTLPYHPARLGVSGGFGCLSPRFSLSWRCRTTRAHVRLRGYRVRALACRSTMSDPAVACPSRNAHVYSSHIYQGVSYDAGTENQLQYRFYFQTVILHKSRKISRTKFLVLHSSEMVQRPLSSASLSFPQQASSTRKLQALPGYVFQISV